MFIALGGVEGRRRQQRLYLGLNEGIVHDLGDLYNKVALRASIVVSVDWMAAIVYDRSPDRGIAGRNPKLARSAAEAGMGAIVLKSHHMLTADRAQIAAEFPRLQTVAAHGCWPWVTEILGVAYRRPNLYVSPDMYLVNMPGALDYVRATNYYLEDRFLFASAYPALPLKGAVYAYRALPLLPHVT